MNTKQNIVTVGMIGALVLGVIGVLVLGGLIGFIVGTAENSTPDVITSEVPKSIVPQNDIEFTVNMTGGMNHHDVITINGTVPTPNSSITGAIYHNEDKIDVTVVQIFQLTADENGFYTYNAVINDDYLWREEGKYTISIQNNGEYKKLYFYR